MMTSIDGRIDCEMTAQLPGVEEYYPLLDKLAFDATVSGKTTARLELAEAGEFHSETATPVNREVVSKKADGSRGYEVVTDTCGTLLWRDDPTYDQPHIILLAQGASQEYLAYLDEKNISYIVTGSDGIDLVRAAELLMSEFGVKRMGVVGGPTINTAFLDAGLVDEVLLLIGAGIDGRASFPPVFNSHDDSRQLVKLKLLEVKAHDSGAVLVRYSTKR